MGNLRIHSTMKLYSLVNLLVESLPRYAVSRMESGVVAICAATGAKRPVAIGAREPCVNHKFLQPLTVNPAVAAGRGVISFAFGEAEHWCILYPDLKVTLKISILAIRSIKEIDMKSLLTSVFAISALIIIPQTIQAQDNKPKHLTFTDKELAVAPTKAVVELSANFMREKPEYEAELGDQALMGTIVEVLENKDGWAKIKSPEPYTAWVDNRGLVMMTDAEIADYLEAPKYICTALRSNIYEEPSLDSRIVSEFLLGDIVRIMYKTITHTKGSLKGYEEGRVVLKKKFVGVVLPSGKTGYVPAKDVDVFYKWAKDKYTRLNNVNAFRKDIVETAMRFIGVPYMWGGTSVKNTDCSGLTRSVFFANGVLLPRNASQQGRIGENLPLFSAEGDVIWDALLPGDLVFWGREAADGVPAKATHVGIYIGEGRFIHSSYMVRISSLDPSSPDYYDRKPLCARRIAGQVDTKDSGIISVFASPDYIQLK